MELDGGDSGLLVELLVVATSGGGGKGRRAERQMRASEDGATSGAQGKEKGEEVLARGRQGVWRRRTGTNPGSSCSNPTAEGGIGLQASSGEEAPWRKGRRPADAGAMGG